MPASNETWRRKPLTRKEMFELFEINPLKHDNKEIEKRIRASEYPGNYNTFVTVGGHKFFFPKEDRKPIV